MPTVAITSLGCARNLVDSEVMLGALAKAGFSQVDPENGADVLIVNTCSFIAPAREESISVIIAAAALKREGKVKHLVVCGCLPQMEREKLFKELPEADLITGTGDIKNIVGLVKAIKRNGRSYGVSDNSAYLYDDRTPRTHLTPDHYRYIKISEGCDNFCSYCTIPYLRGRLRSRTIKSVVKEMEHIVGSDSGVKEINIIGQDTTLFGLDRYGRPALDKLLLSLARSKNAPHWIRILYTHPAHYSDDLIRVMRDEERICRYADIPIQHISDSVLKRMNRPTSKNEIIALIEKIRKEIPNVALRTSIIVGFPGETEKEFEELLSFVRETRFERLGAFIYSKEKLTPSAKMKPQIPEEIKRQRLDLLMGLQQQISCDKNKSLCGTIVEVLIEEQEGDDRYAGRTAMDAPEVDQTVHVHGRRLSIGDICRVKITSALEYDLEGEAL